jgi:hypothetical protein
MLLTHYVLDYGPTPWTREYDYVSGALFFNYKVSSINILQFFVLAISLNLTQNFAPWHMTLEEANYFYGYAVNVRTPPSPPNPNGNIRSVKDKYLLH